MAIQTFGARTLRNVQGGIASVNRGFMATLGRDSAGSFFYFSSYEFLKRKLVTFCLVVVLLDVAHDDKNPFAVQTKEGQSSPSVAGTLFAGGMAGVLNWIPALPFDTLKSRLQVAPVAFCPRSLVFAFFVLL